MPQVALTLDARYLQVLGAGDMQATSAYGGGSKLGSRCGRTAGCMSAGLAPMRTAARCAMPRGAGVATASS